MNRNHLRLPPVVGASLKADPDPVAEVKAFLRLHTSSDIGVQPTVKAKLPEIKNARDAKLLGKITDVLADGKGNSVARLKALNASTASMAVPLTVWDCSDSCGNGILLLACKYDNVAVVKFMLDEGYGSIRDRNKSGRGPLHVAVAFGQSNELSTFLLDTNADVNTVDFKSLTPLMIAADRGNVVAVKALVDAGADIDAMDRSGQTAFFRAASVDDIAVMRHLAAFGCSIDKRSRTNHTALALAARRNSLQTVKVLWELGADIEATPKNSCSWTPLLMAAAKGHSACCRLLASLGANLHATDEMGSPAVFLASQGGHLATLQQLALHGADLNSEVSGFGILNHFGLRHPNILAWVRVFRNLSQLHIAAALRDCSMVKKLLREGHHTFARDENSSPLWFAQSSAGFPGARTVCPNTVRLLEGAAKKWHPEFHFLQPSYRRNRIFLAFVIRKKLEASEHAPVMPHEIWVEICRYL